MIFGHQSYSKDIIKGTSWSIVCFLFTYQAHVMSRRNTNFWPTVGKLGVDKHLLSTLLLIPSISRALSFTSSSGLSQVFPPWPPSIYIYIYVFSRGKYKFSSSQDLECWQHLKICNISIIYCRSDIDCHREAGSSQSTCRVVYWTFSAYVAVPCKNRTSFHCIFRQHYCVQSAVVQNFC